MGGDRSNAGRVLGLVMIAALVAVVAAPAGGSHASAAGAPVVWSTLLSDDAVAPTGEIVCLTATRCLSGGQRPTQSSDGGLTWTSLGGGRSAVPTGDVDCVDATRCYGIGGLDVVRTDDAGATWSAQSPEPAQGLRLLACPTATTCLGVGDSGIDTAWWTVRSDDGGMTWTAPTTLPSQGAVFDVDCSSPVSCVVVGAGFAAHTADGGATWSDVVGLGGGSGVRCVPDALCLTVPELRASFDGGLTWAATRSDLDDVTAVGCTSAERCIVAGSDFSSLQTVVEVVRPGSTDPPQVAAVPWSLGQIRSISCVGQHCVATAEDRRPDQPRAVAIVSDDGGETWDLPDQRERRAVAGLDCPSIDHCVSVGSVTRSDGYVEQLTRITTDGGATWRDGHSHPVLLGLDAVQCTTDARCVAIGRAWGRPFEDGLYSSVDGGDDWTVVTVPGGDGTDPSTRTIGGLSCPTTRWCMAFVADQDNDGALRGRVLVSRDGGSTWTVAGQPWPDAWLRSLTCRDDHDCFIVTTTNAGIQETSWVTHDGGTTWATAPVGGAVSCVAGGDCYADGGWRLSTDGGRTWRVMTDDERAATPPQLWLPSAAPSTVAALGPVVCPSATRCYALGGFGAHGGMDVLRADVGPAPSPPTVTPPGPSAPPAPRWSYDALVPARLLETRTGPGLGTVDGVDAGIGVRGVGTTTGLRVAGRGGVAADASAVTLNVTAVDARQPGYVTVYPCGTERPRASSLNYVTGATVANAVVSKVGTGGSVCLFTSGATDLVVDVAGAFPAGAGYAPLDPGRLMETRTGPGLGTVDGLDSGGGVLGAGQTHLLHVAGRAGVPSETSTVMLNVTAVGARQGGYVTVYPCTTTRPVASSLNYTAGATVAAAVVATLSMFGDVCLFTSGATDLVVDVVGAQPAVAAYAAIAPARLLETRHGLSTVDGSANGIGVRSAGSVTTLHVGGRGGVPTDATTVMLNVTAVDARQGGYVTVHPCTTTRPMASSLNYVTGAIVANTVISKVGAGGDVCLYTSGATDLVVDVTGAATTTSG